MPDLKLELEAILRRAATSALDLESDVDPLLRRSKGARFGDYQANLAMPLAKQLKQKPREIAERVVAALKGSADASVFEEIEIAGPGFINLRLAPRVLDERLQAMFEDERLGVAQKPRPQTVVVDYSSPNLAKEMHIGHLRSSIIGDAICRVLVFAGDQVTRQNHLGDWGTQFGMLVEHLIDTGWDKDADHTISDLNELYQSAKRRFDEDGEFAERARGRVVLLQAGEERTLSLWRQLVSESVRHMNGVYQKLGLLLKDGDIRPESFYNAKLPAVVDDLRRGRLLLEDQGAQVVFVDGYKNKEGDPLPLIVQKSDGGFGYAATDLACIRFRTTELSATRLVYVVDSRQADHFGQVFGTARKANWAPEGVSLEHVQFGTILGKDKKPFKTRTGGTVRLADVMHEAVERARSVIAEKNPDLPEDDQTEIATAVGIGAVKYADLSSERIKDYTFDWEQMLALDGNTAPYLQNAHVRVRSIFRKGNVSVSELSSGALRATEPAERALALELLQFPQVVDGVCRSLEPHRLCNYLYDLASSFHTFYEKCHVLGAGTPEERQSRLALSHLVGQTLRKGLDLLGIVAIDQM